MALGERAVAQQQIERKLAAILAADDVGRRGRMGGPTQVTE
jgi:hypothetical protein